MARELKRIIVKAFEERFSEMDGCVLIDYHGINAEQTLELRSSLRESGVKMQVVHNRFARRALAGREGVPESLGELFRGPTAILYGEDGPLSASKILAQWKKKNKDVAAVKGGLLEGRVLDEAQVDALAKIPDRETMQSQVAAMFIAPAQFLASASNNLVSHLAGCAKSQHEAESTNDEDKAGD